MSHISHRLAPIAFAWALGLIGACAGEDQGDSPGGAPGTGGATSTTCSPPCAVLETCSDGACVCAAGREDCAGACVDVSSDPANCGSCGAPCAMGAVCSFGICADVCAAGRVACSGACVDLSTDAAHCGDCSIACAAGETCGIGVCTPAATGGTGGGGGTPTGGTAMGGEVSGGAGVAGTTTGGQPTGGASTGGTLTGGTATGGLTTGGASTGGASTGGASTGGASTGGASTGGTGGTAPLDLTLTAVVGNGTVGLEWPRIAGATSYRVYWSTSPGVTPATGTLVEDAPRGWVHRGLANGQAVHYVVTVVSAAGESAASAEIAAVPAGEWVLEELGTGDFTDVRTGAPMPTIAVADRVHVLLFPEGYVTSSLGVFHDDSTHDGARGSDVDRWVDEVFAIEPYSLLREAFVVWYLPRASNTDIRAASPDTAFAVPVDTASSFAQMASVSTTGTTATLVWSAIGLHPYPPTDFTGPSYRRARNAIASLLIFDPNYGRASVSGLTTSLQNPANPQQSIGAAFAMGHAHEFTHAFSALRDEYLENNNAAPTSWSGTSNVAGTNACAELPWAHLLLGTPINPSTDQLVGAFGTPAHGYHPELLCLLNGTHDNGEYYSRGDAGSCAATSCTLRVNGRMCNFCRETTALRIHQRTARLEASDAGLDTWISEYRTPFYGTYGFAVPPVIPQSNDVNPPDQGTPIFEACVP